MSEQEKADAAKDLLRRSESLLSLELRARLQLVIVRVTLKDMEERRRVREHEQAQDNPYEA